MQSRHLAVGHAAHAASRTDAAALSAGKGRQFLDGKGVNEIIKLVGIGDHFLKGHVFSFGELVAHITHPAKAAAGVDGQSADPGIVIRTGVFYFQPMITGLPEEAEGPDRDRRRF